MLKLFMHSGISRARHFQEANEHLLKLVPRPQHTPGSIFWNTVHPNGERGGGLFNMGSIMTLLEITQQLDNFDKECTIYAAEPWTKKSKAIVSLEPKSGELPAEAKNQRLKYFIEISIASDFLHDWAESFDNEPTLDEKCERLIHYAVHDA